MKTIAILTTLLSMLATSLFAEETKPLKALMITGGGYHDYKNQKKIIAEGISARANVEWTVVLENPKRGVLPKVYKNKDWAKGYDVIVHNECYAGYTDAKGIERIVKDHLDRGVGSVMIHCAMHTFRDGKTKEWDKLVGVESRRHGAHFAYVVKNLAPDHPITKAMPGNWMTPKGELYHTSILDSATTLAVGYKPGDEAKTSQVCVWANTYQKCRTFGITIGHHNETMQQKVYLDLLTRGLLWSCRKLDDDGKPAAGYGKTASADKVRFQVILANGKQVHFDNARKLAASGLTQDAVRCCGQ